MSRPQRPRLIKVKRRDWHVLVYNCIIVSRFDVSSFSEIAQYVAFAPVRNLWEATEGKLAVRKEAHAEARLDVLLNCVHSN